MTAKRALNVDYIYSIPAGDKMDRAVALYVYGFDGSRTPKRTEWEWWGVDDGGAAFARLPNFSGSRDDAFILVDKYGFSIGQTGLDRNGRRNYYVGFDAMGGSWRRHDATAFAEELPLAVCRAALLYVMFGEPQAPSGLKIGVLTHEEGCIHVNFSSPDTKTFNAAVERLKRAVPKSMRSYDAEAPCWNFRPQAKQAVDSWLAMCVREFGAEVHYKEGTPLKERLVEAGVSPSATPAGGWPRG